MQRAVQQAMKGDINTISGDAGRYKEDSKTKETLSFHPWEPQDTEHRARGSVLMPSPWSFLALGTYREQGTVNMAMH